MKKDKRGNEIDVIHPNARYTIRLSKLENLDPHWDDRDGLVIQGIFYGGMDSDTNVPVCESLIWDPGAAEECAKAGLGASTGWRDAHANPEPTQLSILRHRISLNAEARLLITFLKPEPRRRQFVEHILRWLKRYRNQKGYIDDAGSL